VAVLLPEAAGKCVRPLQRAIGGVALTGVENAFLSINSDEDNEVVELVAVEIVLLKEIAATVDDSHGLGVKARGSGEREKEHGEFVWRAALKREDIRCGLDVLYAFGAVLVL
jgi:hypothetical protein